MKMAVDKPTQDERFMRLFVASERDLLRYILAVVPNPSDARDIIQETAVALWRKMTEYDPERPFLPWACRFASIEIRRFLRRAEQQQRILAEETVALLLAQHEDRTASLTARRVHLRECLSELPADQYGLVRGYYWDEQEVQSLAGQSGRTIEAVYKALQRIRQALSDCMNRKAKTEGASA